VLVLDHERLYNDLQRDLPSTTHIVPLPKSGGVSLTLYVYMLHVRNFISRLCCAPIQFQDWFTRCICKILESMQIPYFHGSGTQFAWKAHTTCMHSIDLLLPSLFNHRRRSRSGWFGFNRTTFLQETGGRYHNNNKHVRACTCSSSMQC